MNRILKYSLWAVVFLMVFLAWVFGLNIDLTGDSGLYAAISRQMVESGDWLNLKINGEPYDQKPHLFFWLAGLGIHAFGNSNWAFKLFPFLFGVSSIYFIYRFALLLHSKLSAKLAAVIAGTSQMFYLYFFDFHTDTVLQAAVILALWQLSEYLQNKKALNFFFGFLGIGLAMLTKGPVGAVLPFFFVLFYLLLKKDFRQLFHPKWVLGILLVLVIASPTVYYLWKSFGIDGLRFYFVDNNLGRVTGEVAGSSNDPFFYLYNLLWAFLPWTAVVLYALYEEIRSWFYPKYSNKWNIAIMGSIFILFLVYSIAKGKAPNYLMILIPPLAVVASGRIQYYFRWPAFLTKKVIYAQIIVILIVLLLVPGSLFLFPDISVGIPVTLFLGSAAIILSFFGLERDKWKRLFFSAILVSAIVNLYFNAAIIPKMFDYQGNRQVLQIFEAHESDKKQLYNFDLEEYELFFNAKDSVRNIATWEQLFEAMEREETWVYTNRRKRDEIMDMSYNIDTVCHIHQRGMNSITFEFLNPETRHFSLETNYLIKTKDRGTE